MRLAKLSVVPVLMLSASALSPLAAQGRAAPPPDTTSVRKVDGSYVLNFTNQQLSTVLSAVAAAGGIGLNTQRIPAAPVTLSVTIPASAMMEVLRGEASSFNLKITGDTVGSHYVTIEGPAPAPPGPTPQQLAQLAIQNATLTLHMYKLKYADATQLAPVLQSLFTGNGTTAGAPGAGTAGANPTGAVTGRAPAGAANGGVAVAGANAGGGAGNASVTVTRMVDVSSGASTVVTGGNLAGAPPAIQAMIAQLQAGGAGAPGGAGALSATSQLVRIVAEETSNSLLIRSTDADWKVIQTILKGMNP